MFRDIRRGINFTDALLLYKVSGLIDSRFGFLPSAVAETSTVRERVQNSWLPLRTLNSCDSARASLPLVEIRYVVAIRLRLNNGSSTNRQLRGRSLDMIWV